MGEIVRKIVDFQWCKQCEHYKKNEDEEPCCDCLNEGGDIGQRKPMYFKQKEGESD